MLNQNETTKRIEYEAQDSFDKKWYPAHVLTGEVVSGKIKIEWTSTGWISWVEPERLRIAVTND
jgi:hypothetical protein